MVKIAIFQSYYITEQVARRAAKELNFELFYIETDSKHSEVRDYVPKLRWAEREGVDAILCIYSDYVKMQKAGTSIPLIPLYFTSWETLGVVQSLKKNVVDKQLIRPHKVERAVHMFLVVQNHVTPLQYPFYGLPRRKAAGLHRRAYARPAAQFQQGRGKVRVGQRFAPGYGNAAVGPVEQGIPGYFIKDFPGGNGSARKFPGAGGADRRTGAAAGAKGAVGTDFAAPRRMDRSGGAGGHTGAAAGAGVGAVHQLGQGRLGLGVGAPQAMQRAAFYKHIGADAGPVMNAVMLYIENRTGHGAQNSFFHTQAPFPQGVLPLL